MIMVINKGILKSQLFFNIANTVLILLLETVYKEFIFACTAVLT